MVQLMAPAPPDIAWLADGQPEIAPPSLTPCPEGWRTLADDDAGEVCEPWPEGGAATCPAWEAHFPGDAGCAPIGTVCPAGDFPDVSTDPAAKLFVLAGAAAGDGSLARPYGTIAEAVAVAAPGTLVVIGAGTYDENLVLGAGVTLRGACPERTVLTSSAPHEFDGVIMVSAADVVIRDLSIRDSLRPAIRVLETGGAAHLEGVLVSGTIPSGIVVTDGAQMTARSLVIRQTNTDGMRGYGLVVQLSASADVRRAVIEENDGVGVFLRSSALTLEDASLRDNEGQGVLGMGPSLTARRLVVEGNRGFGLITAWSSASLDLEHVIVRDTRSRLPDFTEGRGLGLENGATATIRRSLFERNRAFGLSALLDSTLRVEDTVVRDTSAEEASGGNGVDVIVQDGATAELSRAVLAGGRLAGVYALEGSTTATLEDVVVQGTRWDGEGFGGVGILVRTGADLSASRALIVDNQQVGIFVGGVSVARFEDTVVRDSRSADGGTFGVGLLARGGATVDLSRALFDRNRYYAIANGLDASLRLTDVVIQDTLGNEGADYGGIGLILEAPATLTRVSVLRNMMAGVIAQGSEVLAQDLVVADTRSSVVTGDFGMGLLVQIGATMDVRRAVLERNTWLSLVTHMTGSETVLEDVVVRDTSLPDCATTTCREGNGFGIMASAEGHVRADRFASIANPACGIHLSSGGEMDLSTGLVADNTIGACVQVDGYDLDRLTHEVVYRDNETNLQATALPTPDLSLDFEEPGTLPEP